MRKKGFAGRGKTREGRINLGGLNGGQRRGLNG
jgi:hypothetical protein